MSDQVVLSTIGSAIVLALAVAIIFTWITVALQQPRSEQVGAMIREDGEKTRALLRELHGATLERRPGKES